MMILKKPTLLEIVKTAFYAGAAGCGRPAIMALTEKCGAAWRRAVRECV
jgi:hypothetical protein